VLVKLVKPGQDRRADLPTIGPGTIHVAHTLDERVPKRQLVEAVEIYQRMVKQLWNQESKSAF